MNKLNATQRKHFSKQARDIIIRLGNVVEALEDEWPLTGNLAIELTQLQRLMTMLTIPSYDFSSL